MEENGGPEMRVSRRESRDRVGQHVRFSKEKMMFAKSAKQNFSTEIFRIAKVIVRRSRPIYELKDLNGSV